MKFYNKYTITPEKNPITNYNWNPRYEFLFRDKFCEQLPKLKSRKLF